MGSPAPDGAEGSGAAPADVDAPTPANGGGAEAVNEEGAAAPQAAPPAGGDAAAGAAPVSNGEGDDGLRAPATSPSMTGASDPVKVDSDAAAGARWPLPFFCFEKIGCA